MPMKQWFRKALLASLFFGVSFGSTFASETLVFGPVNVISMQNGEVLPGQAVSVRDGRIENIRPFDKAERREGARHIPGRDGYLIPGLAEMHAHIPSKSKGESQARAVLALYLANGITTARGMLGEAWHLELRAALERGEWAGPRLITSGPSFNGRTVRTAGEAARRAQDQADAGYDFLKLHPGLEPGTFGALVGVARQNGIPFAGHVSWAVGLDAALTAGQATIDHLDGYAEALVPEDSTLAATAPAWFGVNLAVAMDAGRITALAQETAAAGVWNVPTQSLLENLAGETPVEAMLTGPGMLWVSAELRETWASRVVAFRDEFPAADRARFLELRRALILALQEAGAGLLLGSDAPQVMNVPGYSLHQELELLVEAGLTPLQALQSGTVNVARFMNQADHGQVAVGFVADFVLLADNPLLDISHASKPLGVMRSGDWYGQEALTELVRQYAEEGLR
jgi:imidazolonepropionase-like amidohydrolase